MDTDAADRRRRHPVRSPRPASKCCAAASWARWRGKSACAPAWARPTTPPSAVHWQPCPPRPRPCWTNHARPPASRTEGARGAQRLPELHTFLADVIWQPQLGAGARRPRRLDAGNRCHVLLRRGLPAQPRDHGRRRKVLPHVPLMAGSACRRAAQSAPPTPGRPRRTAALALRRRRGRPRIRVARAAPRRWGTFMRVFSLGIARRVRGGVEPGV